MARRRREVAPEAEAGADAVPAAEGPGPQATLTVRGSADAVKKQLGVGQDTKPETEKKKEGNGHDDEKQKFIDALRNPRFLVRVRRQSPRTLAGHCWDVECPIPYTKLQDETKSGWGGGTFRAVIVDPESNKTITGDTFDIPGDPAEPETEMSEEDRQRLFMQGGPKSAGELTVDGLNRRAEVTAKMLEVESLEAQLEDARKRRENRVAHAPQDNTRIDELDRKLAEAKHQAELEARDRKHAEEMRELKALIAQNAQPKKAEGDNMMMMLLDQMREDRKQQQAQFTMILTQMKDDKLNAVLDEVKSIRNRPNTPATSLLDQAEAILKLKKVFGWGGDDEEEEEVDDKDDDRPWWERALDKLGGKLGDQLFAKFTNMEEKGEKVDRAKFMAEMSQYADQVAAEAAAKVNVPRLPAPAPSAPLPMPPVPAARPAVTVPAAPATSLPPPPPPTAAAPAPAPAPAEVPPAPVQALPQRMTIEQEIAIRVGGVLEMIDREIELRPHEYVWNYEGAYNSLPESVLEAICAAQDPVAMFDAFVIPGISAEGIAAMKAKVSANPRMLAWLKVGHDELKTWWAEKQKDPRYDPFAGEEGEEE